MYHSVLSYIRILKDKILQYFYFNDLNLHVKRIKQNEETCFEHISKMMYDPTHIIDNIYLGNALNASNYKVLEEYNIKHIVNVTREIPNYFEDDINYLTIKIADTQDSSIINYIDEFITFMNKIDKKENILIHCYMGSSRSATFTILYLNYKYNMTIKEALDYVINLRDIVNLNETFLKELVVLTT